MGKEREGTIRECGVLSATDSAHEWTASQLEAAGLPDEVAEEKEEAKSD